MSVLLITKPSNFDLHRKNVVKAIDQGILPAAELDRLKTEHSEHYSAISLVESSLKKNKVDYTIVPRADDWPVGKKFEFVITVGGDGTLLGAAKLMQPDVPIAGICSTNTSVGFLCSVKSDNIETLIEDYKHKRLPVKLFARLGVKIKTFDEREIDAFCPIVNDVLFSAGQPAATARYVLSYKSLSEEHKSSGVWISTAAGSNAAIFAAGGRALDPASSQSQFCVREPYGGKTAYQLRNEVFDAKTAKLKILVKMIGAKLSLDGTQDEVGLEYGDEIEIFQDQPLNIVRYD